MPLPQSHRRESQHITLDGPSILSETSSLSLPTLKRAPLEPEKVTRWNTSKLGLRIGSDAISAAAASVLVAPLICVLDRSIVEKASTGTSFSSCLRRALYPALTRPHRFLVSRPFFLIFTLYFSTYFTANTVDTLSSTLRSKPASTVTSGTSKFLATSAVNMSMCVYKDSTFAKLYSPGPSSPIPRITYALFALRDSLTIFASFNLPPLLAPHLTSLPPQIQSSFSRLLSTESRRTNTAQFLTPAAMQILSTPIHLLGLDLYNRQGQVGFPSRVARIVRDWGVSAVARMGRIVPAFGVGGVVNANLRRQFMRTLE